MSQKRFVPDYGRDVPVVNMLTPRSQADVLAFTEAFMEWVPKFDEWKEEAKKKWKAGEEYGPCPEFPDPNCGIYSEEKYQGDCFPSTQGLKSLTC